MGKEFPRILVILLFVAFGSLSAYGFDRWTRSQQAEQIKIHRVEARLQQLPRAPAYDLKRLLLLCQLVESYQKTAQKDTSKDLQRDIKQLYSRLKLHSGASSLSPKITACAVQSHS